LQPVEEREQAGAADYASGQGYLFDPPIMRGNIAAEFAKLTAASEDTAQDVASKEARATPGSDPQHRADYETARLLPLGRHLVRRLSSGNPPKTNADLGRLCPTERVYGRTVPPP
jgi:hypothetical protein